MTRFKTAACHVGSPPAFRPSRRLPKIMVIAALAGTAAFSAQPSMALTPSPEVKLKLERTNPPDSIPFTDEFELFITYDLDSFGPPLGTSPNPGVTPSPLSPPEQPGGLSYNFQGRTILSVRGTYTNPPILGSETYQVPLQAPAPIGSSVTNLPSPPGPAGTNTPPPLVTGSTPTIYSAFWPLGTEGGMPSDPNYYYPPDLTTHGLTDNLYNPDGGFTPGDPGFPDKRINGVLSYGGLMFFVDYGEYYATEGYPNRYLPYQVFFRSLTANDPDGDDYGGCPGDCGVSNVPGPLPLLGVGAAFGFSRKLRNRIKASRMG
jgi:hypothetical protein